MKKEIPKSVFIGAIAVVAVIGGFVGWKVLSDPPELPRAEITVGEEAIPSHMDDKLSPEMKKMIEEQTKKYGTKKSGVTAETSQPNMQGR